jgi:hypothetical protein
VEEKEYLWDMKEKSKFLINLQENDNKLDIGV